MRSFSWSPSPSPTSIVRRRFTSTRVGFHADHDHALGESVRFVQLTPPGSACSIVIGTGITSSTPGSAQGLLLVVSDIEGVRSGSPHNRVSREISGGFARCEGKSFAYFQDPDGNSWQLQQPE